MTGELSELLRDHAAPWSTDLVVITEGSCPACGDLTDYETTEQPAMLAHGGYGATAVTVVASCRCGWSCVTEQSETRP